MRGSTNGGTPYHIHFNVFLNVFLIINHPAIGVPSFMETWTPSMNSAACPQYVVRSKKKAAQAWVEPLCQAFSASSIREKTAVK
jgi:hypothetical protein